MILESPNGLRNDDGVSTATATATATEGSPRASRLARLGVRRPVHDRLPRGARRPRGLRTGPHALPSAARRRHRLRRAGELRPAVPGPEVLGVAPPRHDLPADPG